MKPELEQQAFALEYVWTPKFGLDRGIPAYKQSPLVYEDLSGEQIDFGESAEQREQSLSFEIPQIVGMDELLVVRAEVEFNVNVHAVDQDPVSMAVSSTDHKVVELGKDDPRVGALRQVVFKGLVVEGAPASGWVLNGAGTSVHWKGSETPNQGSSPECEPLHLLVCLRPAAPAHFSPPVAAAPAFAMPEDPGGLYGDALGGAQLSLKLVNGKVEAKVTLNPPLEGRSVDLRIAVAPKDDPLPHQATPIRWRAESLDATWATKLRGLEVDAWIPAMPSLPAAPVSSFPGTAASNLRAIDFSAAARSLLRTAYREQAEPTLELRMKSGSVGQLLLKRRSFDAEYRKFLVDDAGVAVGLRGGVEWSSLTIPSGLIPARFTLTFDGRFGPAALVAAADSGELDPSGPKSGYRIADTLMLARWVPLSVAEAGRPLTRVSVEGRGSGDCELLLALHRGDPLRIGTRYADPVALSVPNESKTRWHRAELGPTTAAPPHPDGVWVVAEVSRGSFFWAGQFDDDEPSPPLVQRSPDAGSSWNAVPGRLRTQVHQYWVDDIAHEPIPEAIACAWKFGQLRSDIRQYDQLESPAFRGTGLPLLGERELKPDIQVALPIDRVVTLGSALDLAFDCRRDVDFRILDAVMTYSPWLSKG